MRCEGCVEMRKLLFFDIDRTIWYRDGEIPESAARAIRELRENGHLTFLCSGRSRSRIQNQNLLNLGFDGIISGCGTMIEYKQEVIFCKEIDKDLVEKTINTVRRYGFRPILEGKEYMYMDDEEFGNDGFGMLLKKELGKKLLTIKDEWGKWEICKLSCTTESEEREKCFALLEDDYDIMAHHPGVAEFVPKGFNKGTGVLKVCELLGVDVKDTFAFGDSRNDLEMLAVAGVAVVMGNGSEEAKAAADYVTTNLDEDGIWNACKHFSLI